jgi:hypothetical protein
VNTLVKKAQIVFKNIVGLDAFINKEQWNIIWMKEEYHTKTTTILQINYQHEWLLTLITTLPLLSIWQKKGRRSINVPLS